MIVSLTVPGFSKYAVTQDGKVFQIANGKFKQTHIFNDRNGYEKVMAYDDSGKRRRVSVHRMVYAAFYGDLKDGLSIDHLNGNKADNRPENLEQVTFLENYLRGRKAKPFKSPFRKMTPENAREARELRAQGISFQKIADRYGVHWSTIYAIVKKNYYKEAI